ncbi:flavin-containing monooxygenase [Actinomycetospora flava]|uniref:NAD(P)/FAD-dependent oxidoreductase n=1 Tax=Actinomycetospora flava TaxID=3129232 RepID=A0ABU8M2Z5_9PSEU
MADEQGFEAMDFVASAGVDLDGVDLEALGRRYREERARRVDDDRAAFVDLSGDRARYAADPFSAPEPRAPVADTVELVVVGAGFGGLLTAIRFREVGFTRIRLIDTAGDVGGVWYWNRYPGAMCDVDSLTYLPLLEETGYVPRDRYAGSSEIRAYARRLAASHGLDDLALFHTTVTGLRWDEDTAHWVTTTDRGDEIASPFVMIADGNFNRVRIPAIPGLGDFRGHSFHTSRWDHAYTGPDLGGLARKRVGVIGTGATAAQVVPPLARAAGHLVVFQRTPSTVGVRANRPLDPDALAGLEPGWQRERIRNFTAIVSGRRQPVDLVRDGWTDYHQAAPVPRDDEDAAAAARRGNLLHMEALRARVDAAVHDPVTAEALKPWYAYFCTRPVFHDEYLATFNRPDTTLVDTGGQGIERFSEAGVVVDGVEHPLDCLVFATGFTYGTPYTEKTGFDIMGRDGLRISEKYATRFSTLHGLMSRGFPNLFMIPGGNMQSSVTLNVLYTLDENALHAAGVAARTRELGARCFDVEADAEEKWVAECVAHARDNAEFLESCTPNRFNAEGDLSRRALASSNHPLPVLEFFDLLRAWRDEGSLPGLELG